MADDAPTPHDQIVEFTDHLHRLAVFARDAAAEAHERGGTEGLLEYYALLKDAEKMLGHIADAAGNLLIEVVPDRFREYDVPSGGTFKIGGGRQKKRFDNDALVSRYATALTDEAGVAAVVTDEGERVDDPTAVVDAIVRRFASAVGATTASFDAWRAGVAKELGIDLKDYCEQETTPLRPRIEGRSLT